MTRNGYEVLLPVVVRPESAVMPRPMLRENKKKNRYRIRDIQS